MPQDGATLEGVLPALEELDSVQPAASFPFGFIPHRRQPSPNTPHYDTVRSQHRLYRESSSSLEVSFRADI